MEITHQRIDGVDLMALSGELVMANCADVRSRIQETVQAGEGRLALDLANVPFVDSSGLSALVSALKAVREKDGQVVLIQATPAVLSLLELTRLNQVFDMFENRDAAVLRLQGV